MRGEGREGGQGRQGPPRRNVNKKTEHKNVALYLGVRGPGQRDTSRGPQAGARAREISTRLRKPPQRTAHPMTNRPQLITQGCLRRVAPGPAPKKTFDHGCVWLGVGVHSRVVSERTPNRKQHMSRQQHTQGLLDLGAAGKTTKRDNRKTTDHLIALRSVSHGTSFKKCAFLSEASSRLPGGHREPPSSPPGVSTHTPHGVPPASQASPHTPHGCAPGRDSGGLTPRKNWGVRGCVPASACEGAETLGFWRWPGAFSTLGRQTWHDGPPEHSTSRLPQSQRWDALLAKGSRASGAPARLYFFAVPHTVDKTRRAVHLARSGAAVHVNGTHGPEPKQKPLLP